ncbi:MAG: LysR family transcriptional regulator [Nannocystaceae bacterium]|nr:LysR family transcriptional regulator [Nannocystaceae bacterium]
MATLELSSINVNLLIALDALLSEQNVTRAARQVGISQSAMSHNLATLRGLLEDPLLVRGPGGMEPTLRAQRIGGPLKRALEALQESIQPHPPFEPRTSTRKFRIATADFIATQLATGLVQAVREQAPDVELILRPLEWKRSAAAVDDPDIDLLIGPRISHEVARQEFLFTEGFVCVVRQGHPTVGEALSLEQYVAAEHILVSPTGSGTSTVDDWLDRRGLSRKVVLRVPWFIAAPVIVGRSDLMLTAVHSSVDDLLVEGLGLRRLASPVDVEPVAVMMTWHVRNNDDAAQVWIRDMVSRCLVPQSSS